jgi:hypothetical protein
VRETLFDSYTGSYVAFYVIRYQCMVVVMCIYIEGCHLVGDSQDDRFVIDVGTDCTCVVRTYNGKNFNLHSATHSIALFLLGD